MSIFETGLDPVPANHQPLSPIGLLDWAADVFPNRIAVIHGQARWTYGEHRDRVRRLASVLQGLGVTLGSTVAVMLPNTPPMLEAHYAVPMLGGVLNTLNTRLDAATIAFQLRHGEAKILIADAEFSPTISAALAMLEPHERPQVIDVVDPLGKPGERLGTLDFDDLLEAAEPLASWEPPADEQQAICLNYTSGTTGNPKGVVYSHRGAYLNAVNNVLVWNLARHPVYLWTLPMFHCNGWCFPWTITLQAGTHVCLRKVDAAAVFQAIADHGVTHLCGAPIVMNLLIHASAADRRPLPGKVELMTAASPPPASVIAAMEAQGFAITHVYGLTEVYGPAVFCAWDGAWDALPIEERASLKARQGVRYQLQTGLMVADSQTLAPVPQDGETLGEVFMRGNIMMRGYLKNPDATQAAFAGDWFHTGDLGVWHPDGYIELKDRAKDIIISGGEHISTIEVETVLYRHPDVLEAAVVARPDETWGETPCAFVTLKPGATVSEEEIVDFCRLHLARYKIPKSVIFGDLPKTSTGKVQKFQLRAAAKAFGDQPVSS